MWPFTSVWKDITRDVTVTSFPRTKQTTDTSQLDHARAHGVALFSPEDAALRERASRPLISPWWHIIRPLHPAPKREAFRAESIDGSFISACLSKVTFSHVYGRSVAAGCGIKAGHEREQAAGTPKRLGYAGGVEERAGLLRLAMRGDAGRRKERAKREEMKINRTNNKRGSGRSD